MITRPRTTTRRNGLPDRLPYPVVRPRRSASLRSALVLLAVGLLLPVGAKAQKGRCDESAGTLGIQGMRCEGCSFRMSESGIEEARFRTEPQVLALARGFTRGDALRAGDRIVALDGTLITTREGSDRLVGLRAGQQVSVRVRREGEIRELDVVAGSACDLRRAVESGEVEAERIEVEGDSRIQLPPAPPASPSRSSEPLPPLPKAPPPPDIAPPGYLGFGFRCSDCGWSKDRGLYFADPPVIEGVAPDGPAARAGLRPGDLLVAVDGRPLTSPEGARAFGALAPGSSARFTLRRDGSERVVTLRATERPEPAPAPRAVPSARPAPDAPAGTVRFEGRLGDVGIEVRGAPVRVTRDEESGELVIRTTDTVIRLRRGG